MELTVLDSALIEEYWRKERAKKVYHKEMAKLPFDDKRYIALEKAVDIASKDQEKILAALKFANIDVNDYRE